MEYLPFKGLTERLFKLNFKLDQQLVESKAIIDKIKAKYDPRAEFNRWRESLEGKSWKEKQYKNQKGCCAICKQLIPLKGSHIDHIKPLASYPDLALDTRNMQITCPDCNISKGNK